MKGKDTMKTAVWMLAVLLGVSPLLSAAENGKSPTVLFQEALYQEETEGDLDKAIELYAQVLEQAADVERLAARATYQLGLCHLKKGDQNKAAEYFQEVVSYYPEQISAVKKAQSQLSKIQPDERQGSESQIILYLQQQSIQAYRKAEEAGVKSNSIAYYVDEGCMKTEGGFISFKNNTETTIDSEISVGNFDQNNITALYNDQLAPQQFRFVETGSETGKYALMWTPDHALKPNEVQILLYKYPEVPLPRTQQGCRLEMKNYFGPEVLENFFLILPANINISKGLDNLTSHQRVSSFDVYLWQKRVPKNTTNSKILELEIDKDFSDAAKPTVIESFPVTYSNNVDPNTTQIKVTFDLDMFQYGWSWCQISQDSYPETSGDVHYVDSKTCILPVKLIPEKSYLVLVNYKHYQAFRSVDQVPAREYAIVFSTADQNGNPTEISEDLLRKAEDINSKNAIPEPVLDIVPAAVRASIADQFRQTHKTAQEKGLRTNSHVHIIDKDWYRDFGMVQIFKNKTDTVLDKEIQMGSNDSPEMYIYDEEGVRQKIRTYKKPGSNYRYFWTPSTPVEPDEERMLIYSGAGRSKLGLNAEGHATLRMQNHYGSPVIEDFYVVLPEGIDLLEQSEPFTRHINVEGYNIYCWSQEQGFNVNHRVDIKLTKKEL